MMRKPRTRDDYWYTKLSNSEPQKVYRECPKCGMRTGIPIIYDTQFCYMCKTTIYVDEKRNEEEKKKFEFLRELKKKGIYKDEKRNNKKNI